MVAALNERKVLLMFVARPSLILSSLRSFSVMLMVMVYVSGELLEPPVN